MKTYQKPKCAARTMQLTSMLAMSEIGQGGDNKPLGSNSHRDYDYDYDDDWDEE